MSDRPQDTDGNTLESDDEAGDGEAGDGEAGDGESEWRFEVDEVGPDGVEREGQSIEPEGIHLEHALFVVFGILLGIGAILATIL